MLEVLSNVANYSITSMFYALVIMLMVGAIAFYIFVVMEIFSLTRDARKWRRYANSDDFGINQQAVNTAINKKHWALKQFERERDEALRKSREMKEAFNSQLAKFNEIKEHLKACPEAQAASLSKLAEFDQDKTHFKVYPGSQLLAKE